MEQNLIEYQIGLVIFKFRPLSNFSLCCSFATFFQRNQDNATPEMNFRSTNQSSKITFTFKYLPVQMCARILYIHIIQHIRVLICQEIQIYPQECIYSHVYHFKGRLNILPNRKFLLSGKQSISKQLNIKQLKIIFQIIESGFFQG